MIDFRRATGFLLVVTTILFASPLLVAQEAETADEQERVFSGPQVGELLPEFEMKQVLGDDSGKTINVGKLDSDQPVMIIFFHEKTRPAFGLMRALANFSDTRKKSGLETTVCFLTNDPSETTQWINQVTRHLPKHVRYGVYAGGIEGPGSYGLNRNVALTVLVANKGSVVHNSALVQPSLESDGSRIIQAIVDVTGGGKAPDIRQFSGQGNMARSKPNAEPNMRPWLAPVIKKEATNEEVDKAAEALQAHCMTDPAARKAVGRIANTVVNSGKLENYGTAHAQEYLKKWAREYGGKSEQPAARQNKEKQGSLRKPADRDDDQ